MMRHVTGTRSIPPFDRIAATFAALVIVGLVAFLLIRNQSIADPRMFFALRVVISLSAATLGASLPGFLTLRWSGSRLVARATGALALFVLTFVYTPNLVEKQGAGSGIQINQTSTGSTSPPIVGNTGTIHIEGVNGQKKDSP
jgi:hypothetical protein